MLRIGEPHEHEMKLMFHIDVKQPKRAIPNCWPSPAVVDSRLSMYRYTSSSGYTGVSAKQLNKAPSVDA